MADKIWKKLLEHDQRFDRLETEAHRQGLLGEDRDKKMEQILDVVIGINSRVERDQVIRPMVDDHELRIRALESTVSRST